MVRIRRVEISNFRSIQCLDWMPSAGINCLIGPGDSGKSTILDAIDLCLAARRSAPFGDVDFFLLDVLQPIVISLTLGLLPKELMNIEVYGEFLRGFDTSAQTFEDEPRSLIETTITLRLTVSSDLEPVWTLFSERAVAAGIERSLAWKDRVTLAPARIGIYANTHLSWNRGSVLNRLTEDKTNLGAELAKAARDARRSFGSQAATQLGTSLKVITDIANQLGVPVGSSAQALLDAHSVSISDGAIALHNETGVPLRSLGTGSSRLLIAGMQRAAAKTASIILVDEVEFGLEPHRLTLLLNSLGSKDPEVPLQCFMTTHSPVAVRELSGDQVFVVRTEPSHHRVLKVGVADDVQSILRADPEAFLAKSVVICEGASEVGFVRGLDQFFVGQGHHSFYALGGAYVSVNGGEPDKVYSRGLAMLGLGYRVLVLADSDKPPKPDIVAAFEDAGGKVITWRTGRALEDELFASLSDYAVEELILCAIELVGEELVNSHLNTQSNGKLNLSAVLSDGRASVFSPEVRRVLGLTSRTKKNKWFKSVTKFEDVAKNIVGPDLANAEKDFVELINQLSKWMHVA